jgi:ABC-type multidrug transport system permease subunit
MVPLVIVLGMFFGVFIGISIGCSIFEFMVLVILCGILFGISGIGIYLKEILDKLKG